MRPELLWQALWRQAPNFTDPRVTPAALARHATWIYSVSSQGK